MKKEELNQAPSARTTLTESEAYRIAAGALRHIPSGYAVEGQRCGDSVVAALLHFTKKAFADGRLAGLEEAALYLDRKWRPHDHESPGHCSLCSDIAGIRGLATDEPKAPNDE